jgi:hypothetical protein
MGRTACTEPQCLYKGALYLYLKRYVDTVVLTYILWIFIYSDNCFVGNVVFRKPIPSKVGALIN